MKKVLYITARSDFGGGPKHVHELVESIENVECYIVSPKTEPYYSIYKKIAKSHIEIAHRRFSIFKLAEILLFCKLNSISIIHSHGRGAGIYSRLLGLFGFKVVHTFHGVHKPKSMKENLVLFIESILKHVTDTFISVSETEKINALNLGLANRSNIVVINNGIDLSSINTKERNSTKVLGTLTRFDPHKNNMELLSFLKGLGEYELIIGGDGEQKDEIQNFIRKNNLDDRVKLVGFVENKEEFFNRIDIFVSASLGEGLPYAILEAMAYKKKIVASDVTGHRDLLTTNDLYELGNFQSFKDKISRKRTSYDMSKFDINYMSKKIFETY